MSLLWLPGLVACGTGEPAGVTFSVPFQAPLDCENDAFLTAMDLLLYVGGMSTPCATLIADELGGVSGECERLTTGLSRPLLLVYQVHSPLTDDDRNAEIAYAIQTVDLSDEALEHSDGVVDVSFTADDVIYSQATVDDIAPDEDPSSLPPLEFAKWWSRYRVIEENQFTLDTDNDGNPNLIEHCANELFQ